MKRSYPKFVKRLATVGLLAGIEERAMAHHVSLRELYEANGASSIVAARKDVYLWLMKEGKNSNEVAKLFDRALSGVQKLTTPRVVVAGNNPMLRRRS